MEIDSPEMERLMDDVWQQMHEEQQRWEALTAEERERVMKQQWEGLMRRMQG